MPCIGLWRHFTLTQRDGTVDFPDRRVRITSAAPPAGRISSVVLNAAGQELGNTRRMGTCTRVTGAPRLSILMLTLVNPTTSREFITTGTVAPANATESDFVGMYEAPDTGETGTGTGTQTTTFLQASRAAAKGKRGAASKGGSGSAKKGAGKGAGKSTNARAIAKKGKK
jgi:hypothetical protein